MATKDLEGESWCEEPGVREWACTSMNDVHPIAFTSPERGLVREQLHKAEEEILALQRKMQELKRATWVLRASLSPVRLLPPEILSRIFEHLMEIIPHAFTFRAFRRSDQWVPAPIVNVSKRWRAVALSTPSLWTRVIIDREIDHDFEEDVAVERLRNYLSRAKNVSISIFQRERNATPAIWDLLASYSSLWSTVEIKSRGDPTVFFSQEACFNHLTSLSLLLFGTRVLIGRGGPHKEPDSNGPLLRFPKLRRLAFDDRFLPFLQRVNAPTLTDLSIHDCYLEAALVERLPTAFPALATLGLERTALAPEFDPPSFPNLTRCTWNASFVAGEQKYSLPFFQNSPSLTILNLIYNECSDLANATLVNLPSVEKLSLSLDLLMEEGPTDWGNIRAPQLLKCFPSLQSLELIDASLQGAQEIAQALLSANTSTPSSICPQLKHLTLRRCDCYKSVCKTLLRVVRQRNVSTKSGPAKSGRTQEPGKPEYLKINLNTCRGGFNDLRNAGVPEMEKAVMCAHLDPGSTSYYSGDEIPGTTFLHTPSDSEESELGIAGLWHF